ncbi:MAG: hypothetical protein AAF152_12850 [Cyanobacteria bacterium P01_A01_bin.114]
MTSKGRVKDWNEALSLRLKDPEFAREFIMASLDEAISLKEVLAKVIRAYGVNEFAKKAEMPSSNVVRAISPESNLTYSTLSKMLSVFGLKIGVAIDSGIKNVA